MNHWSIIMLFIKFSKSYNTGDYNEFLWCLKAFFWTLHYQIICMCVCVCVGHFSSALHRSMCGFISSNRNVLRNIWWDYLQKLGSLQAFEVSSCWLRITLIELIASILLLKLLYCYLKIRNTFLWDFLGQRAMHLVIILAAAPRMAHIPQQSTRLAPN